MTRLRGMRVRSTRIPKRKLFIWESYEKDALSSTAKP